jgi:SHS2 domain-containing protein
MSERIEFLDDVTSDLAFVTRGETPESAFAAAADALLYATVAHPEAVEERFEWSLELEEPDVELLLLAFLNELVFLRDARGWLMRAAETDIEQEAERATLRVRLVGEALDIERHGRAADVKAATAHGLRVVPRDGGWEIGVTLDV